MSTPYTARMTTRMRVALAVVASAGVFGTGAVAAQTVRLETTAGSIVVKLDAAKAPRTVENFVGYVKAGFYDGTIFHRVMPGFMIQGGGFTPDMQQKPTGAPIPNEGRNGLPNKRGSIAMARTPDPDSATSQFFINVADNAFLDQPRSPDGHGYAVFGQVVKGMDIVDRIVSAPTTTKGPHRNVPVEPIVIKHASVEK